MPQEFMILKCFSCSMFQVHQIRKSKTWKCKLCNEKQSQQKLYGQGTGKECRMMVQQLNLKKKDEEDEKDKENSDSIDNLIQEASNSELTLDGSKNHQNSKWQAFRMSSNKKEIIDISSDEEERPMTHYDVRNVFTNTTLDSDDWSGSKKRRIRGQGTNQKKHDNEFVSKQVRTPAMKDTLLNETKTITNQIPNFSIKSDAIIENRKLESTTVSVCQSNAIVANRESNSSSKWLKFGIGSSNHEDSSSEDNDVVIHGSSS